MKTMRSIQLFAILVAFTIASLAQAPEQGRGGGRGRGAQAQAPAGPAPGSASVRTSVWGRLRTAVAPVIGWTVGVPVGSFRQDMFAEAAVKADALGVSAIEGSSAQKVSLQVPKKLDWSLFPGEVQYVRERLSVLNLRMPLYSAGSMPADESSRRKLFEFAKALSVQTVVVEGVPENLAQVDTLAGEFGVNVALAGGAPQAMLNALQGRSQRIGVYGDVGRWMHEGVKPVDGITLLKDKLLALRLSDRNSMGSGGRPVAFGSGAAEAPRLLAELDRMQLKPVLVADASGTDAQAELARSLDGFEQAVQMTAARRVAEIALKTPEKSGERFLSQEQRDAVIAAMPRQAVAKPKKPRKLLVMDMNIAYGGPNGGHITNVAAANMVLRDFAKATGAFEPVFSNDLNNLKYDKIKQFDAIFLNNTVGMIFVDPEVRDGLLRFVREGGGLAGDHGTSHASMDWPDFAEMLGAVQGTHREPTEQAIVRIEDTSSPITAAFGGNEFLHQDEFYRFNRVYSRDKVHVLLSMDVEKTDMNQGRGCSRNCVRADGDYALAWIRSHGKGRVFYTPLGHTYQMFANPQLAQFFLAGIQFILGDLDADTTPSSKLKSGVRGPGGEVAAR
ncbi:MAG: ThuA domain-containing protein [Candidatus Korobacteraceae bacterium]